MKRIYNIEMFQEQMYISLKIIQKNKWTKPLYKLNQIGKWAKKLNIHYVFDLRVDKKEE